MRFFPLYIFTVIYSRSAVLLAQLSTVNCQLSTVYQGLPIIVKPDQ
ncbi:MAG: hypothetical protein HC849_13145 [Oscillatoriales cyanobacterium RU_3_3]|nr:hypothetical protein [Oscillatoriales cyanobacterium RU_3_3]